MNSNFKFLENEFPVLLDRAKKAEQLVITDPRASLFYARMALEVAVNWMYANDKSLEIPFDKGLHNLLLQSEFKAQFNFKMYNELHLIKKMGNLAAHNQSVSEVDAHISIENLFYFSKWFIKSYSQQPLEDLGIFNFEYIPKKGEAALSKKQIKELENQLDTKLSKFQEELKAKEEEKKQLAEINALFKKQIEILQAQIEANKVDANIEDEVQHPRNEAETRKHLIDVSLREAGWDLKGINDKEYKVQYMPKSTNKSETGYVDYVLWDDDGLPLALVEAKRT